MIRQRSDTLRFNTKKSFMRFLVFLLIIMITTRRFPVSPTKNVMKYTARLMVVCKALVVVWLADVSFIANVPKMIGWVNRENPFFILVVSFGTKWLACWLLACLTLLSLESKDVGKIHMWLTILLPNRVHWKWRIRDRFKAKIALYINALERIDAFK